MCGCLSGMFEGARTFLPLVLAVLFGGIVGLEREAHGRPAGLRTHILVCLGSAAVIVAFEYLHRTLEATGGSVVSMDPARAAAGVITGIGFLGAGTIIKSRDHVRGLTTAASIWVVAAVGITLGLGQYALASGVTVLVLLTLFILDRIEIPARLQACIVLEGTGGRDFYNRALGRIAGLGIEAKGCTVKADVRDGSTSLRFDVRYRSGEAGPAIIDELSRIEGVRAVSWE